MKFDLYFRHHSSLSRPHLETKQDIGNVYRSIAFGAALIELCFSKFGVVCSTWFED